MRAPFAAIAAALVAATPGCRRAEVLPPVEVPAPPREQGRTHVQLATLGLRDAQLYNTQPTLSFPFFARADRALAAARVNLAFSESAELLTGIRGMQVLVNQETVATLGRDAILPGKQHSFAVDPQSLLAKNQLTLRLLVEQESACGKMPAGIWRAVKAGEIELQEAPLPLPDDLALLPLPFVDRAVDQSAAVPVVLPHEPTPELIATAARLASWFGVDNGMALSFPVTLGGLPESSAIVFADAPAAAALGLPPPGGPSVRMMDHPKFPGTNRKLLVLSGKTTAEVESAVGNVIAIGTGGLKGASMKFGPAPQRALTQAYEVPRWLPSGLPVRLDRLPGGSSLEHAGMVGGRITARFRIPPDVWIWPEESLSLDLGYLVTTPPGTPQPRLDVVFNDRFLATLRPLEGASAQRSGRAQLRLHRSLVRGFNELVVHISYAEAEQACSPGAREDFRVAILPDSVLHLEQAGRYASLPDVSTFIDDGFPFTRVPDLHEAAAVLADNPTAPEISTLLSIVAHMGQVTGAPGSLPVLPAERILALGQLDKDLLVVGLLDTHPLLRRWIARAPVVVGPGGGRAQMPAQSSEVLSTLEGRRGQGELDAAQSLLAGLRHFSAVFAFESPLQHGRSVVAVSATGSGDLPSLLDLKGFASSQDRSGDLMVVTGARRSLFRIGPRYGLGHLGPWTRIRWFVANHLVLLLPALLFGVAFVILPMQAALQRRARQRLSVGLRPGS